MLNPLMTAKRNPPVNECKGPCKGKLLLGRMNIAAIPSISGTIDAMNKLNGSKNEKVAKMINATPK